MQESVSIRILEKDANRRGDLFGRLMADLFVALGYEQPSLNVHKSGRELDLFASHRLEARRAMGECKATVQPVGGDDLNKFAGALDVEQDGETPLTGYFISLGGFKETALEQERQRRQTIVTLDGSQVIAELVSGRILIPQERATELAGRCCAALDDLSLDSGAELLAHQRGWIWAIYYTQGKLRTHFALIHSDGTLLARALADEVTASDHDCGGSLRELVCLNPAPPPGSDADPRVAGALDAYGQYLAIECGYIQLDGLPADSEVGSRRLRLENLFVPLHLDLPSTSVEDKPVVMERQAVGEVLAKHPRLALLAAPGGGKSTLLKRLAIAYVDPSRREQIDDGLPPRDWLPLFFRCRELRGLARGSFSELLDALSQREPVRQHSAVFRACADRALLAGRVLLLVDGLDEIADAGDRAAFVCTLRSALQAYPGTAIVITSREAGFRHVAAHLAPICTYATLSPLNADDIRRLAVAWHREVVGDTPKVQSDAEQLAGTIATNDRIRRLAINPLLLTTLLLVKRWVGSLPTRRAVLYGKAVEVLLMTWNVEGHEPMAEEEAMPQLCYIAAGMMLEGRQKISRPRLAALLQQAREALPTELGYVKETVDQFIHRIEDRSSLLMMTGHDVEDGRLVEFFEFRHLTFQEFLTARAMVEAWHPDWKDEDTLASVLEPHFNQEEWREVIPLAAVLGGKATEELIRRLTERLSALDGELGRKSVILALGQSLADEAAARPETIRAATLARGRYGKELQDEAERAVLCSERDLGRSTGNLREIIFNRVSAGDATANPEKLKDHFLALLSQPGALERSEGALGLCRVLDLKFNPLFWVGDSLPLSEGDAASLCAIADAIVPLLFEADALQNYVAAWTLYVVGMYQSWLPPVLPDVLGQMFLLWQSSSSPSIRRGMVSNLVSQRLAPREAGPRCASIGRNALISLMKRYNNLPGIEKGAALVVAWYRHAWTDARILGRARKLLGKKHVSDMPAVAALLKEPRRKAKGKSGAQA